MWNVDDVDLVERCERCGKSGLVDEWCAKEDGVEFLQFRRDKWLCADCIADLSRDEKF